MRPTPSGLRRSRFTERTARGSLSKGLRVAGGAERPAETQAAASCFIQFLVASLARLCDSGQVARDGRDLEDLSGWGVGVVLARAERKEQSYTFHAHQATFLRPRHHAEHACETRSCASLHVAPGDSPLQL